MRVLCRRPCLVQSQFLCAAQALSLQHQSCLWSLTQPRHMCASPSATDHASTHVYLAVCHSPIPSTSGPHLQTGRGRQSRAWPSVACPPALANQRYGKVGLCHWNGLLLPAHPAPGGRTACQAGVHWVALLFCRQGRTDHPPAGGPQPGSLRIPSTHLPVKLKLLAIMHAVQHPHRWAQPDAQLALHFIQCLFRSARPAQGSTHEVRQSGIPDAAPLGMLTRPVVLSGAVL